MIRHAASLSLAFALLLMPGKARAQFEIQDSGTTADLRGIVSVGNGVAWASGTHGTVLRTEDSGFVWQGCAMPPGAEKLDFRGIQAFDDRTAVVMSSGTGDLSRVYKTTDGCVTWKLVFTNPDAEGFFDAISFSRVGRAAGHETGIMVGDPVGDAFPIFASHDGGSHWQTLSDSVRGMKYRIPKAKQGEALFAASNQSLLLFSNYSLIFVTGGVSGSRLFYTDISPLCELASRCTYKFTSQSLPQLSATASGGAFAFAVQDRASYFPIRMVVVGGDYNHPEAKTGTEVFVNSGSGFKLPYAPEFQVKPPVTSLSGYRSSIAYFSKTKTWITVGPNGTDFSRDDGKNWQPLHPGKDDQPDADRNWNALSLPFVVGPHGRIGRLRDNALDPPSAR